MVGPALARHHCREGTQYPHPIHPTPGDLSDLSPFGTHVYSVTFTRFLVQKSDRRWRYHSFFKKTSFPCINIRSFFWSGSSHTNPHSPSDAQRLLRAVQKKAIKGDPQSVISTIDYFCRHSEWAMNVGDEKGIVHLVFCFHVHFLVASSLSVFLHTLLNVDLWILPSLYKSILFCERIALRLITAQSWMYCFSGSIKHLHDCTCIEGYLTHTHVPEAHATSTGSQITGYYWIYTGMW